VPAGSDPRFSPDGKRIAYWVGDVDSPSPSAKVFVTDINGGLFSQIGAEFADARYPLWASDGKSILFQGIHAPQDEPEWWVVPIAPGPAINTGILSRLRKLHLSPLPGPGDWKGNYLAFSAQEKEGRHIWLAAIKPPGFRLDGQVRQITSGTGMEADLSMSSNGRIAVSGWTARNNLWRVVLPSGESLQGKLEQLSESGAVNTHPSICADGKKMAFLSRRSGIRQVWIRDLLSGKESCLTIGMEEKSTPVIARDGSRIAYSIIEEGKPSIYVAPTDSSMSGGARRACKNCGTPSDWIPDMSGILYTSGVPQSVYRFDFGSEISTPILQNPAFNLDQPHISPDGRWIAFVAAVSPDRSRIYLSPLENAGASAPNRWIAVTDGNSWDDKPRWLDNDSLIYYSNRDHFGCLWKQQLTPGIKQPAGIPAAVYHFHELKRSPRTLYRIDFDIAVAKNCVVLNLVEIFGDIWLKSLPLDR
jgi:hypothetical protein